MDADGRVSPYCFGYMSHRPIDITTTVYKYQIMIQPASEEIAIGGDSPRSTTYVDLLFMGYFISII